MNLDSYSEKRHYARVALKSHITACLNEEKKDPVTFSAIGKNIGVEGMLLTSEKKLRPGKILALDILFPGETVPIKIKGQIRWCASLKENKDQPGPFDTGIQFIDITRNHLRLLVKNVCGSLSEDMYSSVIS